MSLAVDIYGCLISIPEKPELIKVEDWGETLYTNQYWRRKDLPDFFNFVEYDKEGNLILTQQQEYYAKEEVRRCKEGFYFLNNGKVTYITGKFYFYLQWWKLEDDIYAEYRDTDRRYFTFLNYWESILWCIFIFRGKKRREGASSQATSNLMYECIFYKNSFCGLVSKTQQDSRDTFTDMVSFGYKQLPAFLQPKQLNDKDSVSELVFAHKSTSVKAGKASAIENDAGHRSRVNFRAPVENAYDRGRVSRGLWDEGGKWPKEVPFSKFISKVSKTMVKGARRVGFAECPSTVNELTKAGGKEFKICWDNANQFEWKGKPTPNKGVRYFSPAFDGFEGFIDKHGMSVIDEPTHEQYEYLVEKWVGKSALTEEDIKKGAKKYLLSLREGLKGDLLEEEIRQNPFDEDEMFMAANTGCSFNSFNIHKRLKDLKENPKFKRPVIFYETLEGEVAWRDINKNEENFHWKITYFPKNPNPKEINNNGAIAIDSYSSSQGGRKYGSKASALIGEKWDSMQPEHTGKPYGHLYGRPAEKDDLHKQILLAARYFGFRAYYEHTADDYYGYFKDRLMLNYLGSYPLNLIDPTKREITERHKGTPLTAFSLSKQMDYAIAYFEQHCDLIDFEDILENALIFDPYNRTEFDTMVSFLILLACLHQPNYTPQKPVSPLIKMYGRSSEQLGVNYHISTKK